MDRVSECMCMCRGGNERRGSRCVCKFKVRSRKFKRCESEVSQGDDISESIRHAAGLIRATLRTYLWPPGSVDQFLHIPR